MLITNSAESLLEVGPLGMLCRGYFDWREVEDPPILSGSDIGLNKREKPAEHSVLSFLSPDGEPDVSRCLKLRY